MKILRIGADIFPPFQYIDEEGKFRGTDLEVVEKIVSKMGFQPSISLGNWEDIQEAFEDKLLDVIFQIQKTKEREEQLFFSYKLRDAVTKFITGDSAKSNVSFDDLVTNRYKVGLIYGFQYGEQIDQLDDSCKVYYSSTEDVIEAAAEKEIDYGVVDFGVFKFLNDKMNYDVFVVQDLDFYRPLYVGFHDEETRDSFNQYL